MKLLKYFYLILIALLLNACDKEILKEEPSNLIDTPLHCVNGIYDGEEGEVSIDCGGPCNPCEFLTAECETTEDSIYFLYDLSQQDYRLEISNVSHSVNSVNDKIEILLETSGQDYVILSFFPDQLEPNKEYLFSSHPSEFDDEIEMEAYVQDNLSFQTYVDFYGYNGSLIVNLIGGNYVMEFCDVNLSNYYNSATYSLGKGAFKIEYFEY